MARIDGLDKVRDKLRQLQRQAREGDTSAVVGFTQSYGIYVHEDLNADHAAGKQAKFLEDPARRLRSTLAGLIGTVAKKTGNLAQGLLLAALRLLREAQQIVPIDTGALKASGFACMEKYLEQNSQDARRQGQAIRKATLKQREAKAMKKR